MKKNFLLLLLVLGFTESVIPNVQQEPQAPLTLTQQQQDEKEEAIILIHGTFAKRKSWFRPGGKFYEELKKQALTYDRMIIPFTWSGSPSFVGRIKASKRLSQSIIQHATNRKLTVIAHSHGGNVFNLATQFINIAIAQNAGSNELDHSIKFIAKGIYDATFEEHLTAEQLMKTTGQSFIQRIIHHSHTIASKLESIEWIANRLKLKQSLQTFREHVENVKEIVDMVDQNSQNPDKHTFDTILAMINEAIVDTREMLIDSHVEHFKHSKTIVNQAFLLATPIREQAYLPAKSIVENVYNIYSHGDLVQRVLGMYQRTFSSDYSDFITNISLSVKTDPESSKMSYPSHNELHSKLLGAEIMELPHRIENINTYGNLQLALYQNEIQASIQQDIDPLFTTDMIPAIG